MAAQPVARSVMQLICRRELHDATCVLLSYATPSGEVNTPHETVRERT